jgi:hypothetical protein
MSGTSTTPGSDPAVADRWRRLSLALRTFLVCFVAIALSGIAVAIAMYPPSDATDSQFEAVGRIDTAFFVVALVMGVVSARRGLRAWLAGYAGTVGWRHGRHRRPLAAGSELWPGQRPGRRWRAGSEL